MARDRWHIQREGDRLILSRTATARFDFVGVAVLPDMSRRRLAQQIRQDMWRQLQGLRGFSPVVEVVRIGGALSVRAGGQVDARNFPKEMAENTVCEMLECRANRSRWMQFAAHRKVAA